MRFLELRLAAYGPFRDRILDFSTNPLAVHVIYGPNEAGKSTALRAVSGFLFGMPHRIGDTQVHKPADLRIGARVAGEDGDELDLVRRKRNTRTLLDASGQEVDEALLERLLQGMSRELYETMFGLDYPRLVRGGEALLAGKGSLGESLFAAGLGVSGLHDVLAGLSAEADRIFTPKATTRPLNQALGEWSAAHKRSRDGAFSGALWERSKREIEALGEERNRLQAESRALREEAHRLGRAGRALPILARHTALRSDRLALGEVVRLAADAANDRVATEREVADAEAAIASLGREIAALELQSRAIAVPESLLGETTRVEELRDRLARYLRARTELPQLRGAVSALDQDLHGRRSRGGGIDPPDGSLARPDVATHARVRALAERKAALGERRRGTAAIAVERRRLAELTSRLAGAPEGGETEGLRLAIDRASRAADGETRAQALSAELAASDAAVNTRIAGLGRFAGPAAEFAALALPPSETAARHAALAAEHDRAAQGLDADSQALAVRRAEIEVEIDALRRAGAVASESDLVAAREHREQLFDLLRGVAAPADGAAAEASYREAVRRADGIADSLRADAERVARLARLLAELEATARAASRLGSDREALAARRSAAEASWREAWSRSGISPLSPYEMIPWLEGAARLRDEIGALAEKRAERDALAAAASAHREALRRALGGVAATGSDAVTGTLAELLASARQELHAAERRERERAELERRREEIALAVVRLEEEQAEIAAEEETVLSSWGQAMAAIGCRPDAVPDEATAVLDELRGRFQTADEAARRRLELEALGREMERFETDVAGLVAAHAPELARLDAAAAANRIEESYRRGREDLVKREQLEDRIADKRSVLAAQEERLAAGRERLAERMRHARAASLAELVRAEERSREAEDLDRRIAEATAQIAEAGGGASLEAVATEFAGLDMDRVAVRLEEIEQRTQEIAELVQQIHDKISSIDIGLGMEQTESAAADAAAEAEACLARARGHAIDYVRVQLAATVLGRQIERYRRENQGPVLGRASDTFRRLTLGSFASLRSDFDERGAPVLRGERPGGASEGVETMSDGTRIQLYLALRLASIARHLEANPPLPLVLDDILEKFDDDRAAAALAVIGELSARIQVLFFTHHQHLVEIARQAIPAGRVYTHTLG